MNVDELLREQGEQWRTPKVAEPDLDAAMGRSARRRHAGIAIVAAVFVVAASGLAWAVLPGRTASVPAVPAPVATPSTPAPSETPVPTTEPTVVPEGNIVAAASALVSEYGQGKAPDVVDASTALAGTVRRTGLIAVPDDVSDDAEVWVLQLRGTFRCDACSHPAGSIATQHVLRALLDGDEGKTLATGTFNTAAELSRTGGVVWRFPLRTTQPALYSLTDQIRKGLDKAKTASLTAVDGVHTTLGQAQQRLFGHTTFPMSGQGVWLVRMTGEFACPRCTSLNPDGSSTGSQLVMAIDRATGDLLLVAVSAAQVDLSGLGVPVDLDVSSFRR
jgi:hypothetical protein